MQKLKITVLSLSLSVVMLTLLLASAFAVVLLESDTPSVSVHLENTAGDTDASADAGPSSDGEIPAALVRREGVQNFLVCGKDRASGLYDVIILAQLDAENNAASLVQIPRDTFAAYTEKSYRKLNGAASALGGIDGLAGFLSANLGVPIDHYVLVDLDCVGDIVDAIGGVTLDIPVDMDYEDKSQNLSIHLKAGKQTLNGDTAEQFLRFRSGYVTADLGRLDAQKLFVSAFLDQVKNHTTLPDLIRIVRTLYGRVTTDLSLGDTVRLVSVGLRLKPERLTMETLPGEAARTSESGAWYYILNREAAYDTVNRMLNVTDAPIPVAAFDPLERFTDAAYPHFEAIYRKKSD